MPHTAIENWQWQAHLELILDLNSRGSRLVRNRHSGPLYVQKPFYPEGNECAHIYLLHPPGGLVSGDTLEMDITLQNGAHSVVTTPGAARMYKARKENPLQRQITRLNIQDGSVLEWFPMEAIVYTGADAQVETTISLGEQSHFIGWEITCLGLPASDQPFEQGQFKQRYVIEKNNLPIFIDQFSFEASQSHFFNGTAGLQGQTVNGFMLAGPFENSNGLTELVDSLRELLDSKLFSITDVHNFCVIRYLGESAFTARTQFAKAWSLLRPVLIDREACEPRIWLT